MNLPHLSPEILARLEEYFDGRLSGGELAEFESVIAESVEVRAHVEAQRELDARLKQAFAYDEVRAAAGLQSAMDRDVPAAIPISRGGSMLGRMKWYAAAAVVALAAVIGFRTYVNLTSPPSVNLIGPEEVYAKMQARQFEPEFVCTTDEEFARTVKEKFGQPLLVAATPEIQLVGWGYGNAYAGRIVGENTLVLITKVGETPVLMFMDKASNDRSIDAPAESGLKVFRRKVGSMVLYEVTPLDEPKLLERTYNPDKSSPPG